MSVFRSRRDCLKKLIVVSAVGFFLLLFPASKAVAKNFTVPPNLAGDLIGTNGNDSITINSGGSVGGEVNGMDGSNTININGTVGADVVGNDSGTGTVAITNNGTVSGDMYGIGGGEGKVTITNRGVVGFSIVGNEVSFADVVIVNTRSGRVGDSIEGVFIGMGNVTIINQGYVGGFIGGINGFVGNATINNSGTVKEDLLGVFNAIGNADITNSGRVGMDLVGSSGAKGTVRIINSGTVGGDLIGNDSGEGNVYIHNSGTVGDDVYGTIDLDFSPAGNVTIINTGTIKDDLHGTHGGDGNVTIVNNGTVGDDITGATTGTGNVSITNSGTVAEDLVGRENGTGSVTIINSGRVGGHLFGRVAGAGSVYINNSGTVGGDLVGNIAGTGNVTIINSGTVGGHLIGRMATADKVTIFNSGPVGGVIYSGPGNDQVTLAGGSVVGVAVDGGPGIDALFLQGPGVVSAPGDFIIGFESVTMNGNSRAVYTGAWNFGALNLNVISGSHAIKGSMTTPLTVITGGGLYVNGNLYSPVTVTGGTLGGSGTVHGNVINGGTVAPGNSIGTLTINGNYTHQAGARYVCEVGASGQSDLLRITGAADLQGGVLQAVLVRGLYSYNTKWTILTADGGITGRFNGFKQLTSSLTLSLAMTQSADRVGLVLSRRPYADFAATPRQLAVATTLDAILPSALAGDEGWAGFMTMLDFDYDLARMQAAFRALSPEMYDAYTGAAMNQVRTFGLLMADRSRAARAAVRLGRMDGAKGSGPAQAAADEVPAAAGMAGPAPASGWSLWARTLGGWSYQSRDGEVAGYSLSTGGVAVGADGPVTGWLRLGVAMAASNTNLSWNGQAHDGDQQAIMAGVYATAGMGGLHIDGSLSYGSYDNSATRAIIIDGVDARAKSSFDGTSLLARLGGGYDFKVGGAVFGPTASVSYLRLERDGFTEHGADFLSLKVKEQTEDYWASSLGFSAAWLWQRDDFTLMPRVAASWQHSFNDERREISASFVDYGSAPFTVSGIAPAADVLTIEAGVTTQFSEAFSAYLEYALATGQGFHSHGFTAGVSWAF